MVRYCKVGTWRECRRNPVEDWAAILCSRETWWIRILENGIGPDCDPARVRPPWKNPHLIEVFFEDLYSENSISCGLTCADVRRPIHSDGPRLILIKVDVSSEMAELVRIVRVGQSVTRSVERVTKSFHPHLIQFQKKISIFSYLSAWYPLPKRTMMSASGVGTLSNCRCA